MSTTVLVDCRLIDDIISEKCHDDTQTLSSLFTRLTSRSLFSSVKLNLARSLIKNRHTKTVSSIKKTELKQIIKLEIKKKHKIAFLKND